MRPRKSDEERVHRYKGGGGPPGSTGKVEVEIAQWDGVVRGPELPPRGGGWPNATLKWWKTWRESPQAILCMETDWETMLTAAELHARMHATHVSKVPSNTAFVLMSKELRGIVGTIGGSFEDRASLGVKVTQPKEPETEQEVAQEAKETVNYAERLLAAQAAATQERPKM